MRNYKPKPCVVCGKEFKPTSAASRACGDDCRKVLKRASYTATRKDADNVRRKWRFHNDPVYRERVLRQHKERATRLYHNDPEYRAKVIGYGRAIYRTPEYRARMAEYRERTRAKQLGWVRACRARKAAGELAAVAAELESRAAT